MIHVAVNKLTGDGFAIHGKIAKEVANQQRILQHGPAEMKKKGSKMKSAIAPSIRRQLQKSVPEDACQHAAIGIRCVGSDEGAL